MIDKTTAGVTAEPEEVEAVLHNLCGYHLAEPDPVFRYTVLTREQVLYDALVTAIKRERGRALADLAASGRKLTEIATLTGLGSRQRVQRLIAIAKAAEAAAAEVQAASREFEERLAAVEATLDEVVSGLVPTATVYDEPVPEPEADFEFAFGDAPMIPAAREPMDDLWIEVADEQDPEVVLEPTQMMPALRGLLHPTKEMPPQEENTPWWRRSRDTTGAA
jgi:hypothetical protein